MRIRELGEATHPNRLISAFADDPALTDTCEDVIERVPPSQGRIPSRYSGGPSATRTAPSAGRCVRDHFGLVPAVPDDPADGRPSTPFPSSGARGQNRH